MMPDMNLHARDERRRADDQPETDDGKEDDYETYEPFVASEGWREIQAPKGPFLVEEEPRTPAFLDEYDQAAISDGSER
jgi:hypothetical protein